MVRVAGEFEIDDAKRLTVQTVKVDTVPGSNRSSAAPGSSPKVRIRTWVELDASGMPKWTMSVEIWHLAAAGQEGRTRQFVIERPSAHC